MYTRTTETRSGTRRWWSTTRGACWARAGRTTSPGSGTSTSPPTTWRATQGTGSSAPCTAGSWRRRKYLVALTKIFEDRGEHLLRAAPPPELDDVRRERRGDRVQPQVCSDLITGTNIVTNNDLHCVTLFYLTAPRSGRCRSRCGASRRGTPPSPTATSPAPSTGCNLSHG